jgi:Dolichyl-phosphate-mannose-protein mannosyltransferase
MAVVSVLAARAALNQVLKRIRHQAVRDPLLATASLLGAFGYALAAPFLNDDYIFLDRTRGAGLGSLWGTGSLMFGWWRPWSREFHYWFFQRLLGPRELGFHLISLAVVAAALAIYFLVARRIGGGRVAAVALAGVTAMAAWAVPMVWVAGVQESWMMLFALAALLAFLSNRSFLAAVLLAFGLLSKETAAVVPAVAIALALITERVSLRAAIVRALPMIAVTLVWALLHPALRAAAGGGLETPEAAAPFGPRLLRTLLAPINLDHPLAPAARWIDLVKFTLPAVVPLVILLTFRMPSDPEGPRKPKPLAPTPIPTPRIVACGLAWAALAWLPAFYPGAGWHSYYTLLGAMGAWIALAPALASNRILAVVVVIVLVVLRSVQGATPSQDWGTEWYQKRAAHFVSFLRADLKRVAPTPRPHTRFFFNRVPNNVGFLTEGGPALRVWYRDPTLSGGFFSAYTTRSPQGPAGSDRFFRYDSTAGWIELHAGRADSVADNPRWIADHHELASRFAGAGDWSAAAAEFAVLADAEPDSVGYASDAGVCFAMAGDSSSAAHWFAVAARRPLADDQVKGWARAFEHHLKRGIEQH